MASFAQFPEEGEPSAPADYDYDGSYDPETEDPYDAPDFGGGSGVPTEQTWFETGAAAEQTDRLFEALIDDLQRATAGLAALARQIRRGDR